MSDFLISHAAFIAKNYSVLGAVLCLIGFAMSFVWSGAWVGYITAAGCLLILVDVFRYWWQLGWHNDQH